MRRQGRRRCIVQQHRDARLIQSAMRLQANKDRIRDNEIIADEFSRQIREFESTDFGPGQYPTRLVSVFKGGVKRIREDDAALTETYFDELDHLMWLTGMTGDEILETMWGAV